MGSGGDHVLSEGGCIPPAARPQWRESKIPVEVGPLGPEHREAYRRFRPESAAAVSKRFDLHHTPIAVWHNSAIIAANWVAVGRAHIPYPGCDIVIPPDAIYTYDAYTSPEYRGNAVAQLRYDGMCEEFLKRGFRGGYAVVALDNRSGTRSALKAGYKVVGRHSLLRLGPWKQRRDEPSSGAYPVFEDAVG